MSDIDRDTPKGVEKKKWLLGSLVAPTSQEFFSAHSTHLDKIQKINTIKKGVSE